MIYVFTTFSVPSFYSHSMASSCSNLEDEEEELKCNQRSCHNCQTLYTVNELFQCDHADCKKKFKANVYCEDCIECIHKRNKQGHELNPVSIELNNDPMIQSYAIQNNSSKKPLIISSISEILPTSAQTSVDDGISAPSDETPLVY